MSDEPEDNGYMLEVRRLAHLALREFLTVQTFPDDPDQALDPSLSVDALMFLAAAILESVPANDSKRELRVAVEETVQRFKLFARTMRDLYDQTGERGIFSLGAEQPFPEQAPPTSVN